MARIARSFTAGFLLVLCFLTSLLAQTIELKSTAINRHMVFELPAGSYDQKAEYLLVDVNHPDVKMPAQVFVSVRVDGTVDPSKYQLIASIPGSDQAGTKRSLRLDKQSDGAGQQGFTFTESDRALVLKEVGVASETSRPIWQYNYGTIVDQSVPENEPRRSRSCYIHPVWGMHGEILSDDFPKDHYHHHGIFWTWPYVGVGDQTYDLWMSTDIQQRFGKWLAKETGPVAAVMGVENGWFVGQDQVATERVWLRSYRSEAECRAIDVTLYIEAGEKPVTLQGRQQKSYGGLTFRYDVTPRKDATVRVPGKTLGYGSPNPAANPDLLNTPLPWADLATQIPGAPQRSGAAVFVHPKHPDFPPTWLTRTYGALCVGWPGVKSHTIPAGESIQLTYRVWIHARELDPDRIEQQYHAYSLTD